MSKPLIELITNEGGDWEVLRLDAETQWENHSLSIWDWIELLETLGYKVEKREISDEDMESGNLG